MPSHLPLFPSRCVVNRLLRFAQSIGVLLLGAAGLLAPVAVHAPAGPRPASTAHPPPQTGVSAGALTRRGTATGAGPLEYSWFRDGIINNSARSPTLTITTVQSSAAGLYTAVVRNSAGDTTSQGARVTITPRPMPGVYFSPSWRLGNAA